MKVRLSIEAKADLGSIADWLVHNASERTALSASSGLRAAARRIGRAPEGHMVIGSYAGHIVRRCPYSRCVMLYRIGNGGVVVMRIADGRQDYLSWLTGS